MNDQTRSKSALRVTRAHSRLSVQSDEARRVGENVHPAIGDDWRDVYRRAEIELRLHLAAGCVDADELAGVGREPESATGKHGT